jgi:hypothetical protein
MAEEQTLGLARAPEPAVEELSKEELQRRLEDARDSISHTVTEIKETVAHQVQVVKDTLDWREQFKKRPVAWSAGALGVGFVMGYGIAAAVKGEGKEPSEAGDAASDFHAYAGQAIIGEPAQSAKPDTGPGLLERAAASPAYHRVKDEVANIGNSFLSELSKTATQVIVPAVIKSIRDFLGGYLPGTSEAKQPGKLAEPTSTARSTAESKTTYHPVRE